MSIEHTARHGADAGYEVVVASDGTSTIERRVAERGAQLRDDRTSATVATCAEIKARSAARERAPERPRPAPGATSTARWVDADSGETFAVVDPATGETVAEVPRMGAAETRRAIEAAQARAAGLARDAGEGARARSCAAGPT